MFRKQSVPERVKIVQACSSDVRQLKPLNIAMSPVFDTAVADRILDGGEQMRGLGVLVDSYVQPGLMTEKNKVKHRPGTWTQRPLPRDLLEYAWQDVAWCVQMWHNMRRRNSCSTSRHTMASGKS